MSLGIAKINRLSYYTAPGGGDAIGGASFLGGSTSYGYDLSSYSSGTYNTANTSHGSINNVCIIDDTYAVGIVRNYNASGRVGVVGFSRSGTTVSSEGTFLESGSFTSNTFFSATSWCYAITDGNDAVFAFYKSGNTIYLQKFYNFNWSTMSCSYSNVPSISTSFSTDPISVSFDSDSSTISIVGGLRQSNSVRIHKVSVSGDATLSVSSVSNNNYSISGELIGVSKRGDDDYLVMAKNGTTAYSYKIVDGSITSLSNTSSNVLTSQYIGQTDTTDWSPNSHAQFGDTVWTFGTNDGVSDTMTFKATGYNETDGFVTKTFTNNTDSYSRAGGWGNIGYGTIGSTNSGEQMIFLNRYGGNQLVVVDKTNGLVSNQQVGFGGSDSCSIIGTWGDAGVLVHGSSAIALLY